MEVRLRRRGHAQTPADGQGDARGRVTRRALPGQRLFSNLPGYVKNAWPVPLNLPAARLSASTIFGRRPGFTLRFRKVIPEYNEPTGIVLKGSQNLYSGHTAIARFTRLK